MGHCICFFGASTYIYIYILFIECLSGLRIQTRHWLGFAGLLAARRFGVEILGPVTIEDVQSCIIDSELVAYDQVNKKILPFQVLTTRGRKNINVEDIKASCR